MQAMQVSFKKKSVLNAEITNASREEILEHILNLAKTRSSAYVCLSNVHMVIEAFHNKEFNHILSNADIAIPDGKPISICMNLLYGTRQEQIAGPDLMIDLFRQAELKNLSIFFYGSSEEILTAMQRKLAHEYPELQIAGMISPPFRSLSETEDSIFLEQIKQSGANIVLVSLGCPKQERWMHARKEQIPAVMLGVGAAFPFYTGHLKRCPKWMRNCSLEWLFRLLLEPKRLFKRYIYTNSIFLLLVVYQLFQEKLSSCHRKYSNR